MADALVSVVLQQLTSILQAEIQQEARLLFGGPEEVQKLTTALTAIRAVLNDAEKKQVKESSVQVWLEGLKAISYDLDDLLDEWNTKIYRPKIERIRKDKSLFSKKMVCFSPYLSPLFCFNQTVVHHDMGIKMKGIKERLDLIAIEKERYHFSLEGRSEEPERLETTPLIDVSEVRGRELDKDTLISKLCDDSLEEISPNGPGVVSIVGMGGMGKTTLAQLAFNDETVNTHFEHKIWVCVSESFDKTLIAKMIIEATEIHRPYLFWPELQRQLQNSVNGKKILLVLDDVRIDDFQIWEPLKVPLGSAALGSRILVTTRNERASMMMEACYRLSLGKLSPVDSWLLFSRFAFYGKSREDRCNLEATGRKIADRCKGLPLALKTLGSLMRFKETKQAWEDILDSELWEIEEVERGIFTPLLLSYYDLPSPMKRCFTYCAIFPKDYKMDKETLIHHWMAQGFLVPSGSMDMEQKGAEYFDNLAMRSFFQDLERDMDDPRKITCKMHEIVHDFAQFLTKNECLIIDVDERHISGLDMLHTRTRHLTLIGPMEYFHPSVYNFRNLRTLLVLQKEMLTVPGDLFRIRSIPGDLFNCLTSLRGLDLSHTLITRLPSEIGKLLHLRWLNLSKLDLEELPNTLSNLYNLQTLNLDRCKRLQRLPGGLGKLKNLRHLNLRETDCLNIFPQGIERLSNLRMLTKFVVSENKEGCNIAELKNLKYLRGHLEISRLEKVVDTDKAKEADLTNKHLQSLDLVFSFGVKEAMENVIEVLQPHPELEALQVYDYGGSIFPNWITLLTKLKHLRLLSCINCLQLPPLGKLPSLEKLLIGHFNSLKSVSAELLGIDPVTDVYCKESFVAFPKLNELTFRFMVEWENWEEITTSSAVAGSSSCSSSNVSAVTRRAMPCLRSLSLYDCPKLKAVPEYLHLLPLEELIITRCPILEQQRQSS
ncbi:putative disease resistance protein RGA4 [Ricinus communis]|uniref:putative disease resistance protein RGA4 n=1 Tax=Ricinus communis TaxID=3988 RepID=UPI00201AC2E1|nr:putative disease resistance protein RGA4 [Ricinus communis]